jgi:hypothetical protein
MIIYLEILNLNNYLLQMYHQLHTSFVLQVYFFLLHFQLFQLEKIQSTTRFPFLCHDNRKTWRKSSVSLCYGIRYRIFNFRTHIRLVWQFNYPSTAPTSERYRSDARKSSKRYRQIIGKCDAKLYRNDIGNFGRKILAPPGFEPGYPESPFQYATTELLWFLFLLVKIVNTLNTFVNTFLKLKKIDN